MGKVIDKFHEEISTTTVMIDSYHFVCVEGIPVSDHPCPGGWGSEVQTICGPDQPTSNWSAELQCICV